MTTHRAETPRWKGRPPTRKPKPAPEIIIRHEYTGEDSEDIEHGVQVWASFVVEEIRRRLVERAKLSGETDKVG